MNFFLLIIAICAVVVFVYAFLVLRVCSTWKKIPQFEASVKNVSTGVSIIVPARNEADRIIQCIKSLIAQEFDKKLFEIIVVDDHSTDSTEAVVREYIMEHKEVSIKIISAVDSGQGKKNAIRQGIAESSSRLIITMDADCIAGKFWLNDLVAFYEKYKPKMIIGPVAISSEKTGFESIQSMELMSLVAFAAAYCFLEKPIMSNGANLLYEREAYLEVNGFEGIDGVASGDDVLLMNKFQKKFPGRIKFIKSKSAVVYTPAQQSIHEFIQQHVRWASKGKENMSSNSYLVAVSVTTLNAAVFTCLILSIFYGKFAVLFLILTGAKFTVDYILLRTVSVFFGKPVGFLRCLVSQLFYSFSVITVLLLSLRGKYKWKDRIVK